MNNNINDDFMQTYSPTFIHNQVRSNLNQINNLLDNFENKTESHEYFKAAEYVALTGLSIKCFMTPEINAICGIREVSTELQQIQSIPDLISSNCPQNRVNSAEGRCTYSSQGGVSPRLVFEINGGGTKIPPGFEINGAVPPSPDFEINQIPVPSSFQCKNCLAKQYLIQQPDYF